MIVRVAEGTVIRPGDGVLISWSGDMDPDQFEVVADWAREVGCHPMIVDASSVRITVIRSTPEGEPPA